MIVRVQTRVIVDDSFNYHQLSLPFERGFVVAYASTSYEMCEEFNLIGTKSFHVKASSERFISAGWRCCQNLKFENCTS